MHVGVAVSPDVFPTHVGMNRIMLLLVCPMISYSPRMWGWGIPPAAGTQKSPAWKFHTGRALRAGAVSLSGRGEDVIAD